MMLAPLLLGWRLCVRMMSDLKLERNLPLWVHARHKFDVEWQCENLRDRTPTWSLNIEDRLREDENERIKKTPSVIVTIPQILPGQKEFASYCCLFPKRGKYLIGPTEASTRFPLGLMQGSVKVDSIAELSVAPVLGKLVSNWDKQIRSQVDGEQAQQRRRGTDQDEFYSLREWRSGDSSRQIHWRSSAKLGKPLIKQFDRKSDRDFALAIDLHSGGEGADEENVERILSCSATMISSLSREVHGKVAVAVCGRELIVLSEQYNRELINLVMQSLATAQAGSVDQLGDAIGQLFLRVSVETPVLVLSTRPRPDSFADFVPTSTTELLRSVERRTSWVQVGTSEFSKIFQMPNETAIRNAAVRSAAVQGTVQNAVQGELHDDFQPAAIEGEG